MFSRWVWTPCPPLNPRMIFDGGKTKLYTYIMKCDNKWLAINILLKSLNYLHDFVLSKIEDPFKKCSIDVHILKNLFHAGNISFLSVRNRHITNGCDVQ